MTDANDATGFLLTSAQELILIDCGTPEGYDRLIQNVRSLGFDPKRITKIYGTHGHYDHVGAAALFQRDFGTRLYLHPQDAAQVETADSVRTTASLLYGKSFPACKVDGMITDLQTIPFDGGSLTVLYTPGHTMGSCCFHMQHQCGLSVLIAADTLHGGYSESIGSSLDAWRNSLDRLCSLHFDFYVMGHSKACMFGDADQRIKDLRMSFANYFDPWFKDFYQHYAY